MANNSTNFNIPKWYADNATTALMILDHVYHWAATVEQRKTEKGTYRLRRIRVTLTHGGRRVSASSVTFVGAVNTALERLRVKLEADQPKLKLTE